MTVVEYAVATGRGVTPEEASDGLFPGCSVVYTGCEEYGSTVTHFFLVGQPAGPLDVAD
jgi:hypothetical protein